MSTTEELIEKRPDARKRKATTTHSSGRVLPPKSLQPSSLARTITLVVLIAALLYFLLPIIWVIIVLDKDECRAHLDEWLLVWHHQSC